MGLETGTYISDLVPTNPGASDDQKYGDDHLRLIKSAIQNTLPNAAKPFYFPDVTAKSANFSVLSSEQNKLFPVDATAGDVTGTLPALAAGDAGWSCVVQKIDAGSSSVIVAPASGTINGAATISTTTQFFSYLLYWTGTTWYALSLTPNVASISSLPWGSVSLSAASSMTDVDKADILPIYDNSATTNKKTTVEELFEAINTLTEITSIQTSADFLLLYDTSGTAVGKAKPSNVLAGSVPAAASQAELEAASSTSVYASPGRLKYHPGVAKVWGIITVSGGTPTLAAGNGIASITDTATGRLTITFSTAFSSANYCVQVSVERQTTAHGDNNDKIHATVRNGSRTTTTVQLEAWDGSDAADLTDPAAWFVTILGDQ